MKFNTLSKIAIAALFAVISLSCGKEEIDGGDVEEIVESLKVTTGNVSDIDMNTYTCVFHANVESTDGTQPKTVIFRVWEDEKEENWYGDIPAKKIASGEYEGTFKFWHGEVRYYSCLASSEVIEARYDGLYDFESASADCYKGALRLFEAPEDPAKFTGIDYKDVTDIKRQEATLNAHFSIPDGMSVYAVEVYRSTSPDLSNGKRYDFNLEDDGLLHYTTSITAELTEHGDFTFTLDGLETDTKYYYQIRVYYAYDAFKYEDATIQGEIKSFTTAKEAKPIWVLKDSKSELKNITIEVGESFWIECINADNLDEKLDAGISINTYSQSNTLRRMTTYDGIQSNDYIVYLGLKACTGGILTIKYYVEGKAYTTTITYNVKDKPLTDEKRLQDIRDYFYSAASSESPIDYTISAEPTPKYIKSNNGVMVFDSSVERVNSDDPEYTYRPVNDDYIYPGSLVYINADLKNGTPQPVVLPCANAAGKVNVYVTFLANGKEVSKKGVKNTPDEIYQAINELVSSALASGSVPAGSAKIRSSCSNSSSKLALDFGVSVNYMKAKCNVTTSTSKESTKIYAMHSFTQEFYTVKIAAEDNDPTNYLGSGVTADILKQVESGRGKIGIISSVSYGRYGYYTKSYEQSKFQFKGSEKVSYGTIFEASSTQDISNLAESTEEWGYIYGGDPGVAGEALKDESKFKDKVLSNMIVSQSNQGVPVAYTVKYLGSGKDVTTNLTGTYSNITAYKPCPKQISADIYNHAATSIADWLHLMLTMKVLKINGDNITENGTQKYEKYWANVKDRSVELINAPEGCVFDGTAIIKLSHFKTSNKSEKTRMEGNIDISDGYLKLCIEGKVVNSLQLTKSDGDDCDVLMK